MLNNGWQHQRACSCFVERHQKVQTVFLLIPPSSLSTFTLFPSLLVPFLFSPPFVSPSPVSSPSPPIFLWGHYLQLPEPSLHPAAGGGQHIEWRLDTKPGRREGRKEGGAGEKDGGKKDEKERRSGGTKCEKGEGGGKEGCLQSDNLCL